MLVSRSQQGVSVSREIHSLEKYRLVFVNYAKTVSRIFGQIVEEKYRTLTAHVAPRAVHHGGVPRVSSFTSDIALGFTFGAVGLPINVILDSKDSQH